MPACLAIWGHLPQAFRCHVHADLFQVHPFVISERRHTFYKACGQQCSARLGLHSLEWCANSDSRSNKHVGDHVASLKMTCHAGVRHFTGRQCCQSSPSFMTSS